MAMAHVCPACGADLSLTRVQFDPVYGLLLVWCPRCGRASHRRAHTFLRRWRELRALADSLGWLAFKSLTGLGTWWLAAFAARQALDALPWARGRQDAWSIGEAVCATISAALGQGAWITAGLAHLGRRRAWLGWTGFLYAATGTVLLLDSATEPNAVNLLENVWEGLFTSIYFALILLAAPAGIPLGRAILRTHRSGRLRSLRRARALRTRERGCP